MMQNRWPAHCGIPLKGRNLFQKDIKYIFFIKLISQNLKRFVRSQKLIKQMKEKLDSVTLNTVSLEVVVGFNEVLAWDAIRMSTVIMLTVKKKFWRHIEIYILTRLSTF